MNVRIPALILPLLVMLPCAAAAATPAPSAAEIAALPAWAADLPIVDVHDHLPRGVGVDTLISRMDEAHVSRIVLMPVFYGGRKDHGQGIADENLVLKFHDRYPARIIPFLGMQRPSLLDARRWSHPDARAEQLVRFAERRLRSGAYQGMGLFVLRHYPYKFPSGARGGEVTIPADTPLMRQFLDLAAAQHVPVMIHYEIDEQSLPSLKSMLAYARSVKVILAQNCGRPDPATLKALLDEYPNLYCNIGGMTHWQAYGRVRPPDRPGLVWFVKNPIEDGKNHLLPEWRDLMEHYADRYLGVGGDAAHPEAWEDRYHYQRVMLTFRTLLSELSRSTARKIAFKNAQSMFR